MKYLLLILMLASNLALADSNPKICVLNFERPEHPMTEVINGIFKNIPEATVYTMASPTDLLECVKDRSTEILILGHALETPASESGDKPVNLAFFRNLQCGERQEAISSAVDTLATQISEIDQKIHDHPNGDPTLLLEKERKLERTEKAYQSYPQDRPYYVVRPILPHVFALAREELERQSREPGGIALKKIRLMSCLPDEVLAEYDDFKAILEEDHVDLDVAPKNRFMSFLEGKTVTSPDPDWMRESVPKPN